MPVVPVQIVPLVVAPGTPREIEDILDVADAANGHYMSNNGLPILVVRNDGVGSINVTVSAHYSQNGLALADLVVAVDAGELKFIGPFTAKTFNSSSGNIDIALSDDSDVFIGAIRA